jgi:hypothetical protein
MDERGDFMKKKNLKKPMASLIAFILLACQLTPVFGDEPQPVRITRTVNVTDTEIGEEFTVNYNISGDPIVVPRTKNEICVVIDCSGSMASGIDGKSTNVNSNKRISIAQKAAINFISSFAGTNTRIVAMGYSGYAGTPKPVSEMRDMSSPSSLSYLTDYINSLSASGATNTGDALRIAYNTLSTKGDPAVRKYIVLLTDGEPHGYTYQNKTTKAFYMGTDGKIVDGKTLFSDSSDSNSNDTYAKGYQYSLGWARNINNANTPDKRLYNTFVIGICENDKTVGTYDKTGLTREERLENIAVEAGAGLVASNPGQHFYKVVREGDLAAAYGDIADKIVATLEFSFMNFSDILPEGITIEPSVRAVLEARGFIISDITYNRTARTLLTVSLSSVLKHKGSVAEGEIYQIDSTDISFSVQVVAKKDGTRIFERGVTKIDYRFRLPDGSDVSASAVNDYEQRVNVTLKEYAVELSDTTIFAGSTVNLAVPVADPDVFRVTWTNGDGSVISLVPAGNTAAVTGLRTGTARVAAKSESTNGYYETKEASCDINVVDVRLKDMYILKGCEIPLSVEADNPKSLTLGLTYSNWRENGGALKSVSINEAGMKIKGVTAEEAPVTLSATVRMGTLEKEISCRVYVLDAEVTPLAIEVPVFNTKAFSVKYTLPADGSANRGMLEIKTDLSGNENGSVLFNSADLSVQGLKLTDAGDPVRLRVDVLFDPDPAVDGDEQKQSIEHRIHVVRTEIDLN